MNTKITHLIHNKDVVATAVVALIVGLGVGYYAHGLMTPSRTGFSGAFPSGLAANGQLQRTGGATTRGTMGGLLSGTVVSKDASSITLNTRDGSSHVVLITPATTVSKSASGTLADVTTGSNITVSGTAASNGTISATLIQLRPAGADTFGPPQTR